jgi:hypothetical protein
MVSVVIFNREPSSPGLLVSELDESFDVEPLARLAGHGFWVVEVLSSMPR